VRLAGKLGPPLVVFAAAQLALLVAAHATGYRYLSSVTWARFDSGFYAEISQAGYSLGPCVGIPGHSHPGAWCGSAGWFPGYPVVVSPFVQLGLSPLATALIVSLAFCLAALALIWIGFLGARPSLANAVCLAFAAFSPGHIYNHTVFPMALAGFALLLCLLFLKRERWVAAGLAGAVLAATYPTGALVAPVAAAWLLLRRDGVAWSTTLTRIAVTSGLTALGGAFVLLLQRVQTGAWDGFFKVQAHYKHDFQDPFANLVHHVTPIFHQAPSVRAIPHFEEAFVAVLVVMLCAHVVLARRPNRPFDDLIALALVVYWFVPLGVGTVDLYRGHALLIPAALLLRRLPLAIQGVALACAIALSVPMAEAFLTRVLG
jgi:hypothetical protein